MQARHFITALIIGLAFWGLGLFGWITADDESESSNRLAPKTKNQHEFEKPRDRSGERGHRRTRTLSARQLESARSARLFPDDWIDVVQDRGGPILRILDPTGQRGVAGAVVAFLPYAGAAREALDHQATTADHFLILATQYGDVFETDERGYCPLPRFWRKGQVAATAHEGYLPPQQVYFNDDAGQVVEYELLKSRQYALKIAGADGKPREGLDVTLQSTNLNPRVFYDRMVSRTDQDGVAWFFEPDYGYASSHARFSIVLPGYSPQPITARPLRPEDAVPVHRLPRGASMILSWVGPENTKDKTVVLTLRALAADNSEYGPTWMRITPQREVRFDDLPLGLRFVVCVGPTDKSCEHHSVVLDGPVNSGGKVRHQLELGAALSTLTARVLNTKGEPMAHTDLLLRGLGGKNHDVHHDLGIRSTDAVGFIRIGCEDSLLRAAQSTLRIETGFAGGHRGGTEALLPQHDTFPARVDLGDLVLQELPVLAAGLVVDDAGQALQNVTLRVALGQARSVEDLSDIAARVDEQGRFRLLSQVVDEPFRLFFERPGFPALVSEELAPGTEGLRLTMPRGGRIAMTFVGRVPGPKAIEILMLGVPAAWDPFDAGPHSEKRGQWTNPHRVAWSGLRPGLATIRIQHRGSKSPPILEISDIEIDAKGESTDSRLQRVALGARIWTARLKIVDSTGRAVEGATVQATEMGKSRYFPDSDAKGVMTLVAASPLSDLFVSADERGAYRKPGPLRSGTIKLAPPCRVHLQIKGPKHWPQAPLFITLSAFLGGAESKPAEVRAVLDEKGAAELSFPEAGRYLLRFSYLQQTSHSMSSDSRRVTPIDSFEIKVEAKDGISDVVHKIEAADFKRRRQVLKKH
ncbi:MAG: hypothetical protein V3W41_04520 [Planctomycetota bacterium]